MTNVEGSRVDYPRSYIFDINLGSVDWIVQPPQPVANPHVQAMRDELYAVSQGLFQPLAGQPRDGKLVKQAYGQFYREWAKRLRSLIDEKKLDFEPFSIFTVDSHTNWLMGTQADWADGGVFLLPHLGLTDQVVITPEGYINAGFFFDYMPEQNFREGPKSPNWVQALNEARTSCFGAALYP